MRKPRPWWTRKRLLLPLAALVLGIAVIWYTWVTSNESRIMVYNESGEAIRDIELFACGQRFNIASLAHEESVRFTLEPIGEAGDATLAVLGTTNWNSSGNYLEPAGGFRLFIKLHAGGHLEVRPYRSWFQTHIMGRRESGVFRREF